MARMFIDKTHAVEHSKLVLFAFDWAKPFRSIMPEPILDALQRFHLPTTFIDMIYAIYDYRLVLYC